MAHPTDRAAAIATAVLRIIADTLQGQELRQQIENALRDEIADIERQAAADRPTAD